MSPLQLFSIMYWIIKPPRKIVGTITAPADKSITHRAIMMASLSEGESLIENYLPSDDCMRTLRAFEQLGIRTKKDANSLIIYGAGLRGLKAPKEVIDSGNSGTTVRLLSGILAGNDFTSKIIGDVSLSKRPMKRIMEPLEMMGAKISAFNGNYLPMEIQGTRNLKAINYESPIASAQVKSCVLLAGIQTNGTTSFTEPVRSRDHTERMLLAAGADITISKFTVSVKGPCRINLKHITVPGDISSAAFFLVAGAVFPSAKIRLENVGINPTRDGIIEVLKKMNAKINVSNPSKASGEPVADITVESSKLEAVNIGADIIPRLIDEIPILVLAATQSRGTTVISGAKELRVKESDRLKTISNELNKMGSNIKEKDDGLIIEGPTPLNGADVQTYDDHRIAMTLAIAGLIANGETRVSGVDCVDTSFPGFYNQIKRISQ